MSQILVIGAGVVGLTTALTLAEAGHDVSVWASDPPRETHSSAAGAVWYPSATQPVEIARGWARDSLAAFGKLAKEDGSGVRQGEIHKWFHRPMGFPWWKELVTDFVRWDRTQVPEGYRCGYGFRGPVIDVSRYLGEYLPARFRMAGGRFTHREVSSLSEAFEGARVVILCTGAATGALWPDAELRPSYVTSIVVEGRATEAAHLDSDHPDGSLYIVPRENETVVAGNFNAAEGLSRGAIVVPPLGSARVIRVLRAIRPERPSVRLEWVSVGRGRRFIAHYGHGRAGFTLSWGSAREVLRLVENTGGLTGANGSARLRT